MRVVLNSMIWPGMLVERASKKSVKISAVDPDDGHSIKIFLIQVSFTTHKLIFIIVNNFVNRSIHFKKFHRNYLPLCLVQSSQINIYVVNKEHLV